MFSASFYHSHSLHFVCIAKRFWLRLQGHDPNNRHKPHTKCLFYPGFFDAHKASKQTTHENVTERRKSLHSNHLLKLIFHKQFQWLPRFVLPQPPPPQLLLLLLCRNAVSQKRTARWRHPTAMRWALMGVWSCPFSTVGARYVCFRHLRRLRPLHGKTRAWGLRESCVKYVRSRT